MNKRTLIWMIVAVTIPIVLYAAATSEDDPLRRWKLAGTFGLLAMLWLGALLTLFDYPVAVARRRGHPQIEAIRICAYIGILFFPAWLVALVWAYAGGADNPAPPPADLRYKGRAFAVYPKGPRAVDLNYRAPTLRRYT